MIPSLPEKNKKTNNMRKGLLMSLVAGMMAGQYGTGGVGDDPEPVKIDGKKEVDRIEENRNRAKAKAGLTLFRFSNGERHFCLNWNSAFKKAEKMGCHVMGQE